MRYNLINSSEVQNDKRFPLLLHFATIDGSISYKLSSKRNAHPWRSPSSVQLPRPVLPDAGDAITVPTAVFRSTAEQGTKRKRSGQSEDDDDESGARGEGSNDAVPLCW